MFTIVEQAGFQFKVSEGETIKVPLIQADAGAEVTLDKVLLVEKDGQTTVGMPTVAGAVVKATVVQHGKLDKILVVKKHRRKDYKRKNGHRQKYTQIKITSITL